MKYKILVPSNMTFDQIQKEISNGGRFIIYPYCISVFFAVTLKRLSRAYFIYSTEERTKYKTKYNLLSYIFGWWGIPWGIIRTIEYTRLNNKGGIDVTEDILVNLNEQSLINGEVELRLINTIFKAPERSEVESLKKGLKKKLKSEILIEELYAGYFLNVEDGEEPYFVIGFSTKNDFDLSVIEVRNAIYSQFLKHVHFEFLNLSDKTEVIEKLTKQGLRII